MTLLDTIKELQEKGELREVLIDLDQVETGCELNFDGSLKEFIDAVYSEKITLITRNNRIIGVSYATNLPYLYDQVAQKRFMEAYNYKPVHLYVDLAYQLLLNKEVVGKVVNNYYVYCLTSGTVVDLQGDVVVKIETNDLIDYLNKETKSVSTNDLLTEILDMKLEAYLNQPKKPVPAPLRSQESPRSQEALPEELEINASDLTTGTTLEHKVKNYLRNSYNRYVAKDVSLVIEELEDGRIKVSNITWGRKKY